MKQQISVMIIFLAIAVFLGIALPFYFARFGFYNGFPELTSFIPISIVLAIGSALIGILYYFIEKRKSS